MILSGERIYIRFMEESDAEALLDLNLRNKEFFQEFSSIYPSDYYTLEGQIEKINMSNRMRQEDQRYSFGIFIKASDELIGSVMLAKVCRSHMMQCTLGYSLDKAHNGKGYITEAAELAIKFAFEELKLHRIEAGAMPKNTASLRVLEKLGFIKEGIARKVLLINGQWEDHQILSILLEEYEAKLQTSSVKKS